MIDRILRAGQVREFLFYFILLDCDSVEQPHNKFKMLYTVFVNSDLQMSSFVFLLFITKYKTLKNKDRFLSHISPHESCRSVLELL